MRLASMVLALAALSTPALALTVQSSANRDQAPHLTQQSGSGFSIHDGFSATGRPMPGLSFSGSSSFRGQTQTFGFGDVNAQIRTERNWGRDTYYVQPQVYDPVATRLELIERTRSRRATSSELVGR